MEVLDASQSPWLEQSVRLWQNGIMQFGPLQSSAHWHLPLTQVQSLQLFPLQSPEPMQEPGGGDGVIPCATASEQTRPKMICSMCDLPFLCCSRPSWRSGSIAV
jgi:hypothetical protein